MTFPLRSMLILFASLMCVPSAGGAQRRASESAQDAMSVDKPHYVGSEACKTCHLADYNGWKKSRMANILLDPRHKNRM